ncbi:MAG: hypothetical protein EOO08_07495 [Chitinophagaceae bacterium]|nr:MAG: hypothetical protein EOO08_07495 [Chitinophagaceae bacterium]
MKRHYTDDSLEDFLKQNADSFQMRPSDKVWKGISDNLKRRNRRIGLFTGFFLIAASLSGYLIHQLQPGSADASAARNGSPALPAASNSNRSAAASPLALTANNEGIAPNASVTPGNVLFVQDGSTATFRHESRNGNGLAASVHPRHRGAAAARNQHSAATQAADYLDAESSATTAEIDRIYTDASLAQPFAALKNPLTSNPNPDGRTSKVKLPAAAKLSFQFFVTPTLSYRSLTENKDFTTQVPQANADPNTYALYNVNDAVTHKPSIGLEVGVSAKYALARNLKVQGGLQFNVSRYSVQAFDNYAPQTATMSYNGGGSAQRTTPYSNLDGGGRKENLQNMYFQVSTPIGFEVKVAGNSRTQFGVTSTIQPTYILSDRVYMLSTDYKTYAEVPWLVRRFNVNTALSTYVGYSTGKLAWQVGPQVRYQLMSSFVSKYPVKENLFDFGLRVGVSLNK